MSLRKSTNDMCNVYIENNDFGASTLYVEGSPFIILGGEIHNSSSSSREYMDEHVWQAVKTLNLNTLICPVYWETIEPIEGEYDFSLVESLLDRAKSANMKLVLLWFGLWKNGESFYAPKWVKKDTGRFTRIRTRYGHMLNTISPFCERAIEADSKAFVKFCTYLSEHSTAYETVIMIQVQNEIGVLGSDRDYSDAAEKFYLTSIPDEVTKLYEINGTWEEAFTDDAPEIFMAYYYARAIEAIAQGGKRVLDIPFYVNTWLKQFPEIPGNYPSGGPIAEFIPLWQEVAPSIDFVAPDIYLSDFDTVCSEYTQQGNPLFIPEARRDAVTCSNIIYALTHFNALGYSPFGIEKIHEHQIERMDMKMLAQLNIDATSFTANHTSKWLSQYYALINHMSDFLLRWRGSTKMKSFMKKNEHERGIIIPLAQCDLIITYDRQRLDDFGGLLPGTSGFVFELDHSTVYLCGSHFKYQFTPKKNTGEQIFTVRVEEGYLSQEEWISKRILNGDELHQNSFGEYLEIRKIEIMKGTI